MAEHWKHVSVFSYASSYCLYCVIELSSLFGYREFSAVPVATITYKYFKIYLVYPCPSLNCTGVWRSVWESNTILYL